VPQLGRALPIALPRTRVGPLLDLDAHSDVAIGPGKDSACPPHHRSIEATPTAFAVPQVEVASQLGVCCF
jgi:hypothetical protein